MPIYEYACNACEARLTVFVRSMSATVTARCETCGSEDVRRLISRVTVIRSMDGGDFGGMDESMMAGMDESDPRAMAAWARRMRQEMGDDAGPEVDEMIEKLERGESFDDGMGDDGFDDDFDSF